MKNHDVITKNVYNILDIIEKAGHEARVVGGAVRNFFLDLLISDTDIATTSLPSESIDIFQKNGVQVIPTGINYGTVTVIYEGVPYEITTLREDVQTFGRRAIVKYSKSFEIDSQRRDFTINAIYMNKNGKIFDYHGGLLYISERKIKFIGDARQRIREDYLRILRYFRFVAYYGGYNFDDDYLRIIEEEKSGVLQLSSERIWDEFRKIFMLQDSYKIISPMKSILDELFQLEYDSLGAAQKLGIFSELSAHERFSLLLKFSKISQNQLIKQFNFPREIKEMQKMQLNETGLIQLKKQLKLLAQKNRKFFIAFAAVSIFRAGQGKEKVCSHIDKLKNFCDSLFVNFDFRAQRLKKYHLSSEELKNIMIATKNYWLNSENDLSSDDCEKFANSLIEKFSAKH